MAPIATKYKKSWENENDFKGWLQSIQMKDGIVKAKCKWCDATFSVSHSGRYDIIRHMNSDKHKTIQRTRLTTKPVTECVEQVDESLTVAAKEGMQVYHMVRHNHSLNSMKCTSEIIRSIYNNSTFSCSSTKASAIISGVLEPMVLAQIKDELNKAQHICISTDTSSHKNITMCPVIIRYFLPLEGVKVRLVEINNIPRETGEVIFNVLKTACTKWQLQTKLTSFAGDNCATNFGSMERLSGNLNVFSRLQTEFNGKLIGIGCLAHVLHNTTKYACNRLLPFDIQHVLVLIYKQFYLSTKQSAELKHICEEMSVEYGKIKGCPATRFLAKKRSIRSVLKIYDSLKEYYEQTKLKVSKTIRDFFDDSLSKFYLIITHDICEIFEEKILKIEGNEISGSEAVKIVDDLQRKLQNFIEERYISIEAEKEIQLISQTDPDSDGSGEFNAVAREFYEHCSKYLSEWLQHTEILKEFAWTALDNVPTWKDINKSSRVLIENGFFHADDHQKLFHAHSALKSYLTEEKIAEFCRDPLSVSDRWVDFFQTCKHANVDVSALIKIVSYALTIPGTTASAERSFSLVKYIWTDYRSELSMSKVQAMAVIKFNTSQTCGEFFEAIKSQTNILRAIRSQGKYNFNNAPNPNGVLRLTSSFKHMEIDEPDCD